MLGLYIHIPFCLKKCGYCDFCSYPGSDDSVMLAYTQELCRRLRLRAADCRDRQVDTVYFGGGTPTLLPLAAFELLFGTLTECYRLTPDCEITVECNPATADREYLTALRRLGVNRLSIGLQSAHEDELRCLGRSHSVLDFTVAVSDARASGFDNISVDLMYGIPNQTKESFRQSLEFLCELSPEHISAYGLKIEEGTSFYRHQNELVLPNEEEEYEIYLLLIDYLNERGYGQYEISNFSRPHRESRHNLRYWLGQEYLGFGVAAHSYFDGERFGNSRDLAAFLRGEDIVCERTPVSAQERDREYIMLSLRLCQGLSLSEFARRFRKPLEALFPAVNDLIRAKYLQIRGDFLSFTPAGFFVSNTILAQLLSAVEE